MLAISQKPERVSNILRSSTCVTRVSGTRWRTGIARGGAASAAMAVMPLLLLAGRWR